MTTQAKGIVVGGRYTRDQAFWLFDLSTQWRCSTSRVLRACVKLAMTHPHLFAEAMKETT